VVASIVAAALAQKSVRYTETIGLDLLGGITYVTDVSRDSGMKRLGSYDGGRAEIRLVDCTVYIKGNRAALMGVLALGDLGLTRAQAKRYAGRWISIPRGDHLYARMADGLTLASLVHEVSPQRNLELVRRKSHGTQLVDVVSVGSGSFGGDTTLTALARGKHLPVATSDFIGYGNGDNGRFTGWNERLNVQAPATSTPISTVRSHRSHRAALP